MAQSKSCSYSNIPATFRPRPKEVLAIGAPWAPYRSVAAWYLWRSLDNGDGQTAAPP